MPARATYALAAPPADDEAGAGGAAGTELVRRFLRCYGPATHTQLAAWAQTAPAHTKALFESVQEELVQVRLDGRPRLLLGADLPRLEAPPRAAGVRVLGGHDPFVDQRDREVPFPDPATRKAVFPAIGRSGIVLVDGRIAALWRGRKQGSGLRVALSWLESEADVGDELGAVARLRGCDHAIVS